MLKRLVNKRIAQFKKDFPDYKESKKGNLYYSHNEDFTEKGMTFNVFNITKGTMDKLGTSKKWKKSTSDYTVLITQTGKFMVKLHRKTQFKLVTMKDVRSLPVLTKCFFIGRKYEYLQDFPNLMEYNFFQGFNSLKEAKLFLGYGFISDEDFYSIFPKNQRYAWNSDRKTFQYLIQTSDEYKSNLISLMRNPVGRSVMFQLLEDYHDMAEKVNYPKIIPRSINRLRELHDEATDKFNESKAEEYPNTIDAVIESMRDDNTTFEDDWNMLGIKFIKLDSQRALYLEGVKQKHCIGRYTDELNQYSFYRIIFDGNIFNIQIDTNGTIRQFYGYRNSIPPDELSTLIKKSNIDYKHQIIFKGENVKDNSILSHIRGFGGNINVDWGHIEAPRYEMNHFVQTQQQYPRVEVMSERAFYSMMRHDPNVIYVVQNEENHVVRIHNGDRPVEVRGGTERGIDNLNWL